MRIYILFYEKRSLNSILSVHFGIDFADKSSKGVKTIWYLLKCPEGKEAEYVEKCQRLTELGNLQEVICFQYQRMLRYKGGWHMEKRTLLPGCVFVSGIQLTGTKENLNPSLIPCTISQIRSLCSNENLIGMSTGIIKNGIPVVTNGPLKGRELMIRKIDRHKRTAEIVVPSFMDKDTRITVGLEIYEKQM